MIAVVALCRYILTLIKNDVAGGLLYRPGPVRAEIGCQNRGNHCECDRQDEQEGDLLHLASMLAVLSAHWDDPLASVEW